jgi:CDP-diacylglycerol--serine O-phosphatidyltransferase
MDLNRSVFLPNLLTIANGVCGFAAIVKLAKVGIGTDGQLIHGENFTIAAYLILLGMVFDVFDGKLARTFGGGSELGAQLDSLCDLVTFGFAPAFMILRMNIDAPEPWQKIVWFLALAYFLGALLRLARFNVENAPDESAHLAFKGLPSPAAAGCIASLVIFHRYVVKFDTAELLYVENLVPGALRNFIVDNTKYALAFLGPTIGFAMVTDRVRFSHMGSALLGRNVSFNLLTYSMFALVLLAMIPEIVLPVAFFSYLLHAPIEFLVLWWKTPAESPVTETAGGHGEHDVE